MVMRRDIFPDINKYKTILPTGLLRTGFRAV